MSDSFTFTCVSCGASLEVPIEYCGMDAECTECAAAFTLPTLEELEQPAEEAAPAPQPAAEPEPVEESANDTNAMADTGTVKIDRASIGMIPDVADQFKVDFETAYSKTEPEKQEKAVEEVDVEPELEMPPKPVKKWWQFWK